MPLEIINVTDEAEAKKIIKKQKQRIEKIKAKLKKKGASSAEGFYFDDDGTPRSFVRE